MKQAQVLIAVSGTQNHQLGFVSDLPCYSRGKESLGVALTEPWLLFRRAFSIDEIFFY